MRCNACRAAGRGSGRFTLPRHPDLYKRDAKCPVCGEKERLSSQEKDRTLEKQRRPSHSCTGYPFPHVPGSMRMCVEHPEYVLGFEPSDEEKRDYETVLATPRTQDRWGVSEAPDEFDLDEDDFEIPGFG